MKGNHVKTEFKKGHPKPKNAYKFPLGNIPVGGFKKGNTLGFKKGHIPWCKGGKNPKLIGNTNGFKKGQEPWNYKGGKNQRNDRYIELLMHEHPFAMKRGYVLEHRYVCEQALCRFLTREETIHHINEIRNDNRPENLYLFPSNKSHLAYHVLERAMLIKPITKSNLTVLSTCNQPNK